MQEERKEITVLLQEQNTLLKKQLFTMRFCIFLCTAALLALMIAILILFPRITAFLQEVSGAVTKMQAAVEEIKEIDITTLNEAIEDLKRIIEPLANLFGN